MSRTEHFDAGAGVRSMHPDDFTENYEPGDYGDEQGHLPNWDDIDQHPGFHGKRPGRETHGGNFTKLVQSLSEHGMRTPVEVDEMSGQVRDGHHRVMAARHAGVPVRYVEQS